MTTIEGQRHYSALCRPEAAADVVLDHTDLAAPLLVRREALGATARRA